MGNLVFQATLGGQVNLVGPNTASTFNLNVPAVAGTLVTTGDTGTVTNTMLAGSIANAKLTNSSVTVGSTSIALGATSTTLDGVNIGATTPGTGAFTTLSASSTVSGAGFSTYLASPPAIGGTAPAAGTFTSVSVASSFSSASAFGFKNRLINAQLNINQRGVSGTVTLAAGAYGHDRFKGGASGCTYTFATSNNVTTLTISAGSLIQVVEGLNLESGTYTLSWTGTAQGKIGGGSFSATGVTGSITGGSNTNIEFNTGTLSLPQLEKGSVTTSFDYRSYGTELVLCQRYCQVIGGSVSNQMVATAWAPGTTSSVISCLRPVQMRASPTLTYSALGDWQVFNGGAGTVTPTSIVQNRPSSQSISMEFGYGVFTVSGQAGAVLAQSSNAKLIESAEL